MNRIAFYLSGHVRHQFTDEFCIPLLPPEDMESRVTTCATARTANAAALGVRSQYTLHEVSQVEYLLWFEQAGTPHLFLEELR